MGGGLLVVGEAVEHQGESEVESIVAVAGGEFGRLVGGVRECLGIQRGQSTPEFVGIDDPFCFVGVTLRAYRRTFHPTRIHTHS